MSWFLFALGGAFFAAVASILQKKVLFREHTLEFSLALSIMNVVAAIPLALFADFSNVDFFVLGIILAGSVPSFLSFLLFTKSLRKLELSESSPLFSLAPIFVTLLAFLFLGERLTMIQMGGVLLMVLGIFVLEMKSLRLFVVPIGSERSRSLFYVFLSLVLYGFSAILGRIILADFGVDPLANTFIASVFIAVLFLMYAVACDFPLRSLYAGIRQSFMPIILISVMITIHRVLLGTAIQIGTAIGLVIAADRLSVLFSVAGGGKFFHESRMVKKIFSSAVIVAGAVLLSA